MVGEESPRFQVEVPSIEDLPGVVDKLRSELAEIRDFHITRVEERSDTELVAEKVFPFIHDGSTNAAVQARYRIRFVPKLVSAWHRSITSGLGEK